jgi:hypothetical protein
VALSIIAVSAMTYPPTLNFAAIFPEGSIEPGVEKKIREMREKMRAPCPPVRNEKAPDF